MAEIRVSLSKAEVVALGFMHADIRRHDDGRVSLDWPRGCVKSQSRLSAEFKVQQALAHAYPDAVPAIDREEGSERER